LPKPSIPFRDLPPTPLSLSPLFVRSRRYHSVLVVFGKKGPFYLLVWAGLRLRHYPGSTNTFPCRLERSWQFLVVSLPLHASAYGFFALYFNPPMSCDSPTCVELSTLLSSFPPSPLDHGGFFLTCFDLGHVLTNPASSGCLNNRLPVSLRISFLPGRVVMRRLSGFVSILAVQIFSSPPIAFGSFVP